jgi:hypothetical protein
MGGILNLEIWQLAILGVGGLGALGLAAVNFRFSILLIAAMLFFTAISQQTTWNYLLVRTIITELQQQRSVMYLASGSLLLLAAVMHVQLLRVRSISLFAVVLAFSGLYAGLIRLLAADVAEGLQSVGFALVTLAPLMLVPPALIRDWWDMYILPRVVAVVALGWCGLCVLQFISNRRALTTGYLTQRFVGMTGNPQHASAFLAFAIICCVFLVLNDPLKRYRIIWIGTAAVAGVFLLWTASRTGVAMTAIGVLACFYGRAGAGAMLLPVVGGLGYFAYSFLAGERVDFDVERLAGGGQTRAHVWRELWGDFVSNPLFGSGGTGVKEMFRAEKSENSLLYGLATYGAGMGLIIVLMFFASLVQIVRLMRLRGGLVPYQRRLVEFIVGAQAMFWAGSVFEGYIVGRVSSPIVYMMLFAAMAQRTIEMAQEEINAARAAEDGWGGQPQLDDAESESGQSDQSPYGEYDQGTDGDSRPVMS